MVELTRNNPDSSVLVDGPEIAIRPISTRPVQSEKPQVNGTNTAVVLKDRMLSPVIAEKPTWRL
jgi:hypothetical protein